MKITATELKNNLGQYLKMAKDEDIIITKSGTPVARLTGFVEKADEEPFTYSFEAPSEKLMMLREPEFTNAYHTDKADDWLLMHNGDAVARLAPVRKKRILGFIKGPPASPETIAELFEPIMTEEELDEWENKPI